MPQYKLAASTAADRVEVKAAASCQREGASSGEPTTTRWPWSSSPRLCSSRASGARLRATTTRVVALGRGCALFAGSVIRIATFPVSLSV